MNSPSNQLTLGCGDEITFIGGIGLNFGSGGIFSVTAWRSRILSITSLFKDAGSSDCIVRIGRRRPSVFWNSICCLTRFDALQIRICSNVLLVSRFLFLFWTWNITTYFYLFRANTTDFAHLKCDTTCGLNVIAQVLVAFIWVRQDACNLDDKNNNKCLMRWGQIKR